MDATARQTRLNFEVREETGHSSLRAFIEGDFEGDGESFRLRHAFGQYEYLLAGKTWSNFANVHARRCAALARQLLVEALSG